MTEVDDYRDYIRSSALTSSLPISSKPNPKTYLCFAQDDLKEGDSERTRVNALSNAKRSLHFQVDILSEALGIIQSKSGKKSSFPQKLDFCVNCGIVGPRILTKLNHLRNAVEHEYYLPARNEVEDFIDVVELFLAGTGSLVQSFPEQLELHSPEQEFHGVARRYLRITFPPGKGTLTVNIQEFNGTAESWHTEVKSFLEEMKAEIERKKAAGKDVVFVGSMEGVAYNRVFNSRKEQKSITISVGNGTEYFKWVSFVVSNR